MEPRNAYVGEGRHPDFGSGVVRFPYRREPYARVRLYLAEGAGEQIRDVLVQAKTGDGKWLLIYFDDAGDVHSFWIPARDAKRISRSESTWIDPYDLGRRGEEPEPESPGSGSAQELEP